MSQADSREQVERVARQALERISDLGIQAHPQNFAVWFTYFMGQRTDLVKAVDAILEESEPFSETHAAKLYSDFFSYDQEGAAVREASVRIETTLGELLTKLNETSDHTSNYGKTLAGISGELSTSASLEEVRTLISDLVDQTRVMQQRTEKFELEMIAANSEIGELRQSLEDMRQEAMTDALTGLYNRKYFDIALADAANEAKEESAPLSVLMLDIDHFKQFNDNYGHHLGDIVLKQVARCLTHCVKGRDFTARYGGEEFVIVLPRTSLKGALTVAEQVRRTVAGKKIVLRSTGQSLGNITLSIGAAELRPSDELALMLQRADEALYLAKHRGRNQVASETDLDDRVAATA